MLPTGLGWRWLLGIFALALALRLLVFFQMRGHPAIELLLGDGYSYHHWALQLAAGDWVGQDVFYQAPLYPYLMGLLLLLPGPELVVIRLAQVLLGALGCMLMGQATAHWFGRRAGWLAGVGLALYPPAIFFDLILQKSVLDGVLLGALLCWLATSARQRWWCWASGGALLGLLVLTRENAAVLLPGLLLWAVLGNTMNTATRNWRRGLQRAAALLVGLLLVLLPVLARNHAVGGEWQLTTSQFGPNFYIGNNPHADGTYIELVPGRGDARYERTDARALAEQAVGHPLSHRAVSDYWRDQALTYIRTQPGAWLQLLGWKTLLALNRVEVSDVDDLYVWQDRSSVLWGLSWVLHLGVILPLAAVGLATLGTRWRTVWPVVVLAASYLASLALFFIFARYRHPLTLLLWPLAPAGLLQLVGRGAWPMRQRVGAALAAAIALALAWWPTFAVQQMRAGTYHNLGRTLAVEQQDLPGAIAMLQRAVELRPTRASSHALLGQLLASPGADTARQQAALAHLQLAVQLEPSLLEAQANLGALLGRMGMFADALPHLQRAAELAPQQVQIQLHLAITQARCGQTEAAVATVRRVLALEPNHPVARALLAELTQSPKPAAGAGD